MIITILPAGFLVDFISVPVTSGFMSAGALIIAIAQLQGFVGLKYKSESIADNLYKLFKNINKVRLTDFTLGISSFVFLLILKVSARVINGLFTIIVEVLYKFNL